MKLIIYIFSLMLCVSSCTESADLSDMDLSKEPVAPALMPMDLSHSGMPLVAMVTHREDYQINAQWNATFGRLELSDRIGMDLFVKEDTFSIASKKAEIERSIFTVKYDLNSDSLICYTTSLPDGTPVYSHVFGSFKLGDTHYTFENNPLVECSTADIAHMTAIIQHIQLSEQAKL